MVDASINLPQLVWSHVGDDDAREAVAWKSPTGWVKTSLGEFKAMVREIALGLHALGIGPGDKVAIHSENRTEWIAADLATITLGAAAVPIYTTQPLDQIRYILEHAEAKAIFISGPEMAGTSRGAANALDLHVIAFDPLDAMGEREITLSELREKGRAGDASAYDRWLTERGADDIAALIYTSGTTGTPKGVLLSHANLSHNIGVALEGGFFAVEPRVEGGKLLSFLPFAHVYEHTGAYAFLCTRY
ncbi:MAG: AMP-binding protein, partial [Pseudomonadota bacterium]